MSTVILFLALMVADCIVIVSDKPLLGANLMIFISVLYIGDRMPKQGRGA